MRCAAASPLIQQEKRSGRPARRLRGGVRAASQLLTVPFNCSQTGAVRLPRLRARYTQSPA
ncbi:protein of unknown function [Cupriavidus taiwanensis]|uniref:Uncharacterized protein n=1 Tax=Cupriavidus taiwanensis TaxID=164546 RepID=A0A7Z7NJF2_9BURK|nr:hypothetical protein CBM2585_A10189 [Cupriavidus taiwanensis]SOY85244.1 protein of unknown function [Cupriavidus taiwanensis]SOY99867.1 hypothetical protein CBM2595_A10195 [Cupriavidus taiwanensis]SOZ02901.1 hypothetical protein CBM2597_A10224 [Cupriavidus taiwanensis]SPC06315.1 hypothetical protein CBM2594_A10226 [Cupriavidus taiwanensis]